MNSKEYQGHFERSINCYLRLNIIELFTLSLHKHRHIQKDLVQLQQVLLNLLHSIMSLLNLTNGLKDLAPPLFMNCHLEKVLTLTSLNDLLYGVLIWLFTCDCEVPAIATDAEIKSTTVYNQA